MIDKRTSLAEAVAAIPDGARVALGGNTLHRGPSAAVHELSQLVEWLAVAPDDMCWPPDAIS